MQLSLSTATVPVFLRVLGNMGVWLDKAEAHAQARQFSSDSYLGLRLAPDMLPLSKQVQIASDTVKGCIARLAGQDVPAWADTEATLADLQGRLRRTTDYVQSVPAAAVEGADAREIVLPTRTGEPRRFTGAAYVTDFALPNLYFHATTTYALLRNAGVELGKRDFLGI